MISLRRKILQNRKSTAVSLSRTGMALAKSKNKSRTTSRSPYAPFRSMIPPSRVNAFSPVNRAPVASFDPGRDCLCHQGEQQNPHQTAEKNRARYPDVFREPGPAFEIAVKKKQQQARYPRDRGEQNDHD